MLSPSCLLPLCLVCLSICLSPCLSLSVSVSRSLSERGGTLQLDKYCTCWLYKIWPSAIMASLYPNRWHPHSLTEGVNGLFILISLHAMRKSEALPYESYQIQKSYPTLWYSFLLMPCFTGMLHTTHAFNPEVTQDLNERSRYLKIQVGRIKKLLRRF